MATLSSPVCDRCEEKPALFECNNCSTGDDVFYLCDGCHGLIHVGKFKSHSVTSLVDKAQQRAKQSISGCVEKLQVNDDLVAARLELVGASKKQLHDCEVVENSEEGRRVVRKFVVTDDITLLSEVVASDGAFCRPVTHPVWSSIAEKVGEGNLKMRNLTPRAVKERAERIVRQHRAADGYKSRQSGTPDTYGMKDLLLDQAAGLFDEARGNKEAGRRARYYKDDPDTGSKTSAATTPGVRLGSMLTPTEKRKPDDQTPDRTLLSPMGESKRPMLLERHSVNDIILFLKERDEIAEARRWEELKLEREKFDASRAEREAMMRIMTKLLEKLPYINAGSADFDQVFDSIQSHLADVKKDCWEQISGILQPRLDSLDIQAQGLRGIKEKIQQCLTTGKGYEEDLPADSQPWTAEAEVLCGMELPPVVDLHPSMTFVCPEVAAQSVFRMLQLPQHRVEGVLAPGTVLDDVRIAERCFLNGSFLFHRHTTAHVQAVQKLSEQIGAACANQPQPHHLNPMPNYLYAVRNSSGIWHRACLEQHSARGMDVPKSINVYLVDISTCFQCRIGDLRILPMKLAHHPFMSVFRGCLSLARGLESREFRWEFSDLVVNKKCRVVVQTVQDGGLFPCRWLHTVDLLMVSPKTGAVLNVADAVQAKLEDAGVLRQATPLHTATPLHATTPAFVPTKTPSHAAAAAAAASATVPMPAVITNCAHHDATSSMASTTAAAAVAVQPAINSAAAAAALDMPLPLPMPGAVMAAATTNAAHSPAMPSPKPAAAATAGSAAAHSVVVRGREQEQQREPCPNGMTPTPAASSAAAQRPEAHDSKPAAVAADPGIEITAADELPAQQLQRGDAQLDDAQLDDVSDSIESRALNDSGLAGSAAPTPTPPDCGGGDDTVTVADDDHTEAEGDESILVHSCLVKGAVLQVSIMHGVDASGCFWPQLSDPDVNPEFLTMMDALNDPTVVVPGPIIPDSVYIGNYCLARYSADGRWYRGLVEEELGENQEVFIRFLDYGNSEYVHFSCLAEIPQRAFDLPLFAFECSLHGMSTPVDLSVTQIQAFNAEVADVDVTLTVVSDDDFHYKVTVKRSTPQDDGSLLHTDLLAAISCQRRDSFVVTDDPDLDLTVKTWADATSSPPECTADEVGAPSDPAAQDGCDAAVQQQQQDQLSNGSVATPATAGETTANGGSRFPRSPPSRLAAVALNTAGAPIRTILQRNSEHAAAADDGADATSESSPCAPTVGVYSRPRPAQWQHNSCPRPGGGGRDRHRFDAGTSGGGGGGGHDGKRKSNGGRSSKKKGRRPRSSERGSCSSVGSFGPGGGGRSPQPMQSSS